MYKLNVVLIIHINYFLYTSTDSISKQVMMFCDEKIISYYLINYII